METYGWLHWATPPTGRARVCRSHLWAEVEVAVDGQHRVAGVVDCLGEKPVAAALQELLQQELGRGGQQRVLVVRGTHVLRGADGGGALQALQRGERWADLRNDLDQMASEMFYYMVSEMFATLY